ncbi:hypothetical protein DRQ17_01485 [bacterium]|nr:MAG: hypothetical protein DRQ17_01485 [bacterium]RKZ22724.1 MAG: hypothetical protein DRQ23_04505 [bacterium]
MTEINPDKEDIEAIKHFLEEREKIKRIVGRIGGKPTRYERIINATFFVLLVISFIIPLIFHGQTMRLLSIEFGVLLISLKILYSLANEAKVAHFQFWILSTIEWRLHDMNNKITEIADELKRRIDEIDSDRREGKDGEGGGGDGNGRGDGDSSG